MPHDGSAALSSVLTDLAEIAHLAYTGDPSWLVAVQFRFNEGYLHVEIDPDDDSVEVCFDPRKRPALRNWGSNAVPSRLSQRYAGLLGRNSAWRWLLRNQQGYEDAFQIELSTPSSTTTLQYLAIASRLHLRHVDEVPMP